METKNLTTEQLKNQRKLKENRDKLKARKNRTHKLIVRGAIAEAAIPGATDMTDEEFQRALFDAIGRCGDAVPCSPQESRGSDLGRAHHHAEAWCISAPLLINRRDLRTNKTT